MHASLFFWSNVLLMDSLTKQPRQYRSRHPMSKHRKSIPFQRNFTGPNYGRKVTARAKKANEPIKNEWKKDCDTWNMITETLNQQLISTHQIHRGSNCIGIQDSNHINNIHLINDRQQFNQLMLVDKDGTKVCAKNLIDPNDSGSSFSMKLNFRLIPVIEGITVARNSVKSSYDMDVDANGNNDNNETDFDAVEAIKMNNICGTDSTLLCDMECTVRSLEFTEMYAKINNTLNVSAAPNEYVAFVKDIKSKAAGILHLGNDNVPMFSTPKKEKPLVCKALFNTPKPNKVTKSRRTRRWMDNIRDAVSICKGLKDIPGTIRNMIFNRFEDACSKLIGPSFEDFHCDFSMTTGYTLLADSVTVQ